MRAVVLILGAAALASCTTAPEPYQRNPKAEQALATLLAGKVAGSTMSCLQTYNTTDMQIIDGRTVAYKLGGRTVYLMHLSPGCEMLSPNGGYALLTRQFGGMGMCRGDIARVIDTTSRTTVGSCGVEGIVPYTTPGR